MNNLRVYALFNRNQQCYSTPIFTPLTEKEFRHSIKNQLINEKKQGKVNALLDMPEDYYFLNLATFDANRGVFVDCRDFSKPIEICDFIPELDKVDLTNIESEV